ncbi:MAG: aminopeptidase P family protein [Actinomycetaceae bacterium]|nr:aminopeptidase P family protein [Actinomycetaceae bacterium]
MSETKNSHTKEGAQKVERTTVPSSAQFQQFISADWGTSASAAQRLEVADYLPSRHAAISAQFPNTCCVIPAGPYKTRSNDTTYRFRAHSAFSHMTGLGEEKEPDAVFILTPEGDTHKAVLYFRPRAPHTDEEFYKDARYGEFWVGPRPTLEDMNIMTGIETKDIRELEADLTALLKANHDILTLPNSDPNITELVARLHSEAGKTPNTERNTELERALSELRLIKDEWEIAQMREAVAATHAGFDTIIRELPRAARHPRGERVVETAFFQRAREEGNGLGYDTIAASGDHANTLHFIDNNGPVTEGDLILVDAGVELDSLYTADITRTLPVSGTFTEIQAQIYQAVLDAAEAALQTAKSTNPRPRFRDVHNAAMNVIAHRLANWGLLPCSAEESLKGDVQYHRRWMPHGTSHHLGLDVHDCAQARQEMYMDATLEPGMCFTIEPGLYFHANDEKVPEEFRGIGVRIEDDILITDEGAERLSEAIPRTVDDVEAWIAHVWNS